jgi:N-acyl-D-amino-acid deacylase
MKNIILKVILLFVATTAAFSQASYDVIIRNGTVYDGSGGIPVKADVGIVNDKVAKIGNLSKAKAAIDIDAAGMAVAPGFINMLSWSTESCGVDRPSRGGV